MNLLDPERPQAAGRPAWAEAPGLVVPSLLVTPLGDDHWQIQFMFPSRTTKGGFSWVAWVAENAGQLVEFLADWETSPEVALVKYYHLEPPKGRVWQIERTIDQGENIVVTEKSLSDLGL